MPLLKQKPFTLMDPPSELDPDEFVYQVHFTKEIFRDYIDYLKHMSLYRQRVWTCSVTGKINLTYEEALHSEKHGSEKVQQLPDEFVKPALHIIQFSTLSLKDLAKKIAAETRDCFFVGAEMSGKTEDGEHPCKILKILEGPEKTCYEVEWLSRKKRTTENVVLGKEELVCKRSAFSRTIVKSFIRESTYLSSPWVLHDQLALKHGISTTPPKDLQEIFILKDGCIVGIKKKQSSASSIRDSKLKGKAIEYPIDDLLVRPAPSTEFKVPAHCVGDLLMVWDFCSSFSRLLSLSPFSLEHFENAICHKDSTVVLLVECHAALLQLLLKDESSGYYSVLKGKGKKITLITWKVYLSSFLEMIDNPEFHSQISIIKRGDYAFLEAHEKLGILRELVNEVLGTDIFLKELDKNIDQRNALGARKRAEALEEAKKKREEDHQKAKSKRIKMTNEQTKKELQDSLKEQMEVPKQLQEDEKDISGNSSKERRRDIYEKEMDNCSIRTNPLGKDRDYNRYWWFRDDMRIFVESLDSKQWAYYTTTEELDALMGTFDPKDDREKALKKQLEKFYSRISEVQKRSEGSGTKY